RLVVGASDWAAAGLIPPGRARIRAGRYWLGLGSACRQYAFRARAFCRGWEREMTSAENEGDATRFLSLAQRRILAAACARLVPADEYGPGAVEAGAVDYIEGLLGAFLVCPPRIWAGGPFSGRFGGEASFAGFHRLTAAEELAWRTRIGGSKEIGRASGRGMVV